MAKAKEFTVTIEDKPGALGKCFLALAQRGVNILAFESYVEERESLVRFLADDPEAADDGPGVPHLGHPAYCSKRAHARPALAC